MERRKFLTSSLAASALAVTVPVRLRGGRSRRSAIERPGVLPTPALPHQQRPAEKTVRRFFPRCAHPRSEPPVDLTCWCIRSFNRTGNTHDLRTDAQPLGGNPGNGGNSSRTGRRVHESGCSFFKCSRQRSRPSTGWKARSCKRSRNGRGLSCPRPPPKMARAFSSFEFMRALPIRITSGKWR